MSDDKTIVRDASIFISVGFWKSESLINSGDNFFKKPLFVFNLWVADNLYFSYTQNVFLEYQTTLWDFDESLSLCSKFLRNIFKSETTTIFFLHMHKYLIFKFTKNLPNRIKGSKCGSLHFYGCRCGSCKLLR